MLDTVKLMFSEGQYTLSPETFPYSSTEKGTSKTIRNPSSSELRSGMYLPRVTHFKRPTRSGMVRSLYIEFSAPKLVFGNNFDELVDEDFEIVVTRLIQALNYLKIGIDRAIVKDAKVVGWHPSKNIVLADVFGCKSVINALQGVDANRLYTVQKTDFVDGEVLHFHCNSKDIAFYDKLADLRKGKISDKRAVESDNMLQVDVLPNAEKLSVLRYELRLNGIKAVRRAMGCEPIFSELFSAKQSQKILLSHWHKLTQNIDYLGLDTARPLEILENYLSGHRDARPQTALAATASLIIASQSGTGALRNVLNAQFGAHAWARIKPLLHAPTMNRYKSILVVTQALETFEPTRLDMLKPNNGIDNNSKQC